jgi:hypothetical protein
MTTIKAILSMLMFWFPFLILASLVQHIFQNVEYVLIALSFGAVLFPIFVLQLEENQN